jgi:hypothetical protein
MSYNAESIAAVVPRLNTQYFLPAIQREFVWKPTQILQLFDSIMRGYPIGSFLFWGLKPENRDKWEVYKFINNAQTGGTHSELASTHGVQGLMLVLDGQQRLTSLMVGLRGTYTIKKKHKRWEDPDAWIKHRLYIDLLKEPIVSEEDGETGIYYGFEFLEVAPPPTKDHYWFEVGRILDFDSEEMFYKFRQEQRDALPGDVTKSQLSDFERTLERLYRAVWKDDVIPYYVEQNQDYDRVLDIFVRANAGGTKLSKSDLLLSMATAKWGDVNAREEINDFVKRLNADLTRKNDLDNDFIMKSCLVLTNLSVQYKVQNFNIVNLTLIKNSWEKIKNAIERGVGLANYFGVDRDNLTSANALIPLIYFLYQRPGVTLRGGSAFDVRNASLARKWLFMSLLNNVFGAHTDGVLQSLREILQKNSGQGQDFPTDAISSVNEDAIVNILDLEYKNKNTFLALSLLYDENGWGTMTYHKDHIFPQSLLSQKSLTAAGVDPTEINKYAELRDRLGNLELLLGTEDGEKSDCPFDDWIKTRDATFKARHLIPDDPKLWKLEQFPDFVKAREHLIRLRLGRFLSTPQTKLE